MLCFNFFSIFYNSILLNPYFNQSILGVVKSTQNQKTAQTSPIELITSSPMLLLNLFLKVSPEKINKRFIETEIGKIKSPYPIGPPEFLSVMKLKGIKYRFIKIKRLDMVQLVIFIFYLSVQSSLKPYCCQQRVCTRFSCDSLVMNLINIY